MATGPTGPVAFCCLLPIRLTHQVTPISSLFSLPRGRYSRIVKPEAASHTIGPIPQIDAKAQSDIAKLRKDFLAAGTNRDSAVLRHFHTDDFTHTHTSGKVDGKDARIVLVMAGKPTVEMAPIPEFRQSCFGEVISIARALSPVKRDNGWQLV